MKDRVNLLKMLGVKNEEFKCPHCERVIGELDDYELNCDESNIEPGVWIVQLFCPDCVDEQTSNTFMFEIRLSHRIGLIDD